MEDRVGKKYVDIRYRKMDRFEPLQPSELKITKAKLNKKTAKKRKTVSGITKKDRLVLKMFEKKVIALNKKMNEQIKNKKSCKKQSLEKTLAKAKKLGLTKRKRKARKQPTKEEEVVPVPVPVPVPTLEQEPEVVKEEPQTSVESPDRNEASTVEESNPSVISSVTDSVSTAASSVSSAAESAAESIGLVTPAGNTEGAKEGGKRGKNGKRRR